MMILPQTIPLFAAGDVWEMLIGVIFFIMWTVAQLLGGRQEAKARKKVRPRPPKPQEQRDDVAGFPERPVREVRREEFAAPAPPAEAAPLRREPRNQEDALRSEVEEFLRRAQGKSEQPKPVPREQPPRRPAGQQPQRPQQPTPQITPVAPVPQPRSIRNEGVAEHVQRHLSTEDISAHTKELGATVATSDDRLEMRLQHKFDHHLGSLGHDDASDAIASKPSDVAAEIAAMLKSPQGMRQIIVANEILRRPDW